MSSTANALASLVGLGTVLYAYQKFSKEEETRENFVMQQFAVKNMAAMKDPETGGFWAVPGTYQMALSPVGGAGMVDYGANIRYNMPSTQFLRSQPANRSMNMSLAQNQPVIVENMCMGGCGSMEGYCQGCDQSQGGCRVGAGEAGSQITKSSNLLPSSFAASNYASQVNQLGYTETTDALPVSGMGSMALGALGDISTQPIIYDRYIYANQQSRLASNGDWIRGDLPIAPVEGQWFNVSVSPNIDLNSGALAAMGGVNMDTTKELLALQSASASGLMGAGAGINFSVQKSMYAGNAGGDVKVTSFP